MKENDRFSAINALEQAMEAYSDDDRVKDLLAKLCIETGDVNKAEKYGVSDLLKIKIKLMQGKNDEAYGLLQNVSNKQTADYYKLLAEYHFNKENWDACADAINNFAKFEPNHPLIFQMSS